MPMLDAPTLTLAVIVVLLALALVATSSSIVLTSRAQRLPAATRYEDIHERLGVAQQRLSAKEAELREVEKAISERDRYAAEAASLREQVETLRRELANLAPARAEIEEVKAEAAALSGEKAGLEIEVKELREERERLSALLDPDRIARLRAGLEELQRERDRVRTELASEGAKLDTALRTIAEARAAEARIAILQGQRDELSAEVAALLEKSQEVRDDIADRRQELGELSAEVRDAQRDRDEALRQQDAAVRSRQEAEDGRERLCTEIGTLETLRDKLKIEVTVDAVRTGGTDPTADPLKDLLIEPASLAAPAQLRATPRSETDALHDVDTYLRSSGLSFGPRTVRAFHTSLKINDTAQLTVLAGVSGTGKSLLPRRYAEAMGIHFQQVAVEPRWDSPQDLLGFYNYVEGKYRATELSRLLAHLDPWRSSLPEGTPDRRNHMAILLLDEMNLARVEYYFSEFLSRLEARPIWKKDLAREGCRDALIPLDIRGMEKPPQLFPAHNILFVGTMNDDESTQSLSDKVLDRGNVLQFPAPSEFRPPETGTGSKSDRAQRFDEWRGWIRQWHELPPTSDRLAGDVIGTLSEIMHGVGKPFGHRLNQSMRAYVANYPQEGNGGRDDSKPLADQVEFRILPKLRGVEIANHRESFDKLGTLVRDRLDDSQLADEIARLVEEQENGSGLFVWRGMARGT